MQRTAPLFKISVRAADEEAAIGYLKERGFSPLKVEKRDDGDVVLLFAPPSEQITHFSQSLPSHLNPKMGIMSGNYILRS